MLKNQRHELFLKEYLSNGWNGQAAYSKVYSPVKSARVQASKILAKPPVRKRLNQMLKKMIKRADITEEKVLSQYEEAYAMAHEQGKPSDMIAATSAQAKLVGMLRDRLEAGSPGDFSQMENASDVLEALAERVGPDAAMKIGEALGLTKQIEAQPVEDQGLLAETPAASDQIN